MDIKENELSMIAQVLCKHIPTPKVTIKYVNTKQKTNDCVIETINNSLRLLYPDRKFRWLKREELHED